MSVSIRGSSHALPTRRHTQTRMRRVFQSWLSHPLHRLVRTLQTSQQKQTESYLICKAYEISDAIQKILLAPNHHSTSNKIRGIVPSTSPESRKRNQQE